MSNPSVSIHVTVLNFSHFFPERERVGDIGLSVQFKAETKQTQKWACHAFILVSSAVKRDVKCGCISACFVPSCLCALTHKSMPLGSCSSLSLVIQPALAHPALHVKFQNLK